MKVSSAVAFFSRTKNYFVFFLVKFYFAGREMFNNIVRIYIQIYSI